MLKTVRKLLECGMAYSSPRLPWVSAQLMVPKPGLAKFCFTTDLQLVYQYTMPNISACRTPTGSSSRSQSRKICERGLLSDLLATFHGRSIASDSVVHHAKWDIIIHACHAFQHHSCDVSPIVDVVKPSAVLATIHLTVAGWCAVRLRNDWNPLWHRRRVLRDLGDVHLNASPCEVHTSRNVSTMVWTPHLNWLHLHFDPRRMDGITDIHVPTTGAPLQQLFCAMQWMTNAIQKFTLIVRPVEPLFEEEYTAMKIAQRVPSLKFDWNYLVWGPYEDF